jgi:hypothetical protein
VEALERRVPVGVGGTGERLGMAERRLLGLGVKLGLPPRRQGMEGAPRRVEQSTPTEPIVIATVRDPDGVLVLLTPGSITQAH